MKRLIKILQLTPALLALVLFLTACPRPIPSSSLTITFDVPDSMISAQEATLKATVEGESTQAVTWSVEGGGSFSDINANPTTFTAPGITSETSVTVKATSTVDSSKSAIKKITIKVPEALETPVVPELTPAQPTIPDSQGKEQPIGASRDKNGTQSDFVIGQILIRPKTDADLQAFLQRYEGKVLSDDTIPEPPANLGITLTPEQRKATEYLVSVNLAKIDLSTFKEDAAKVGMGGLLEVSSQEALLTLAGATSALATGLDASPNYLDYPQQAFPTALFETQERANSSGFNDAFTTDRFQSTGSQSNVTQAWQFTAAHGIQRRVVIAVVDGGFLLNPNGTPLGTDHDFPSIVGQYDFVGNDYIADGPSANNCSGGTNCFWHGTGSVGVAAGVINNQAGAAGTGALVADVMLFRRSTDKATSRSAIRTAVLWEADIVSMSFGGACNTWCDVFEKSYPFDDLVEEGRKTVFVAAAGNNGENVDDEDIEPCTEVHVICVGALNDNGTTLYDDTAAGNWKSASGNSVDIYAPTNIPVMTRPAGGDSNPAGPATTQSLNFSGTSASAPFVAGVAAMMKAINPDLNSDQVNQILRDTAHRGPAPVTHYIDAYAAVRRAAEGIDGVKDRYEPNPFTLTGAGPWNDHNFHNTLDTDFYQFTSARRSRVTVRLDYPEALGQIPWRGLNGISTPTDGDLSCGAALSAGDAPLGNGRGHTYSYTVGSGVYGFSLGGGLINAYNVSLSFATAPELVADGYESNNTPTTARALFSFKGLPGKRRFTVDPSVTINANLQTSGDVDYYTIQAATPSLRNRILYQAVPSVQLYDAESAMTLEVYERNRDGSQGNLVSSVATQTCKTEAVTLTVGKEYLIKVSGQDGTYSLSNGFSGSARALPILVRDRLYEILHPGEPIENPLAEPRIYVFAGDKAYQTIVLNGQNLHTKLYDAEGNVVAEGVASEGGETLSLAGITTGNSYALEVVPVVIPAAPLPMSLNWTEVAPVRSSANLILNARAEEGPGNDGGGSVDFIQDWLPIPSDFIGLPTVVYYNGENGLPNGNDPGPDERGSRFFAGAPGDITSGMQQTISIPEDWLGTVANGLVKFNLSAFLGGNQAQRDSTTVKVTFLNTNAQVLGDMTLGPVSAEQRENKTGLFLAAASDYVPIETRQIVVSLEFQYVEGDYNDGYADNLELTLAEYSR